MLGHWFSAICSLPRTVAKILKLLVRCDIGTIAEVKFLKTPYFQNYDWFQNKNYILNNLLLTRFTNLELKQIILTKCNYMMYPEILLSFKPFIK